MPKSALTNGGRAPSAPQKAMLEDPNQPPRGKSLLGLALRTFGIVLMALAAVFAAALATSTILLLLPWLVVPFFGWLAWVRFVQTGRRATTPLWRTIFIACFAFANVMRNTVNVIGTVLLAGFGVAFVAAAVLVVFGEIGPNDPGVPARVAERCFVSADGTAAVIDRGRVLLKGDDRYEAVLELCEGFHFSGPDFNPDERQRRECLYRANGQAIVYHDHQLVFEYVEGYWRSYCEGLPERVQVALGQEE